MKCLLCPIERGKAAAVGEGGCVDVCLKPANDQIVIAVDGWPALVGNEVHDLIVPGDAADLVARKVDGIDALRAQVGGYGFQRGQIAVNVGENGNT